MDLYNSCWFLVVLSQIGFCTGDLLPPQVISVRGKNVSFTASVPPSTTIMTVTWSFNPKPGTTVPIYTAMQGTEKVPDSYKGRVQYNTSTNTLQLSAVTPSDQGTYTLNIIDSNVNTLVGQTSLVVLEPVADVSIVSNLAEALEFNSTVILTCSAKGSSLTYSWTNNSIPVVVDGTHIMQNGSQLIINGVFRNDLLGPITCTANNAMETSTSAPFNLTVYYGPEHVFKKPHLKNDVLKKGTNLTFTCSAVSSPAAQFIWLFNGSTLPQTTSTLQLTSMTEAQSGNYSCMAYNSKTQRYVPSHVSTLTVIEAISGVEITGPNSPLIAGNSTANLTCTSKTGKASSVHWSKEDKPLDNPNHVIFNADQSTVTILTVTREDAGDYKCHMKNQISGESKHYMLNINYGPEDVMIKGDKHANFGQSVTINCSFASVPPPTFVWKFNDSVVIGESTACLTIPDFESANIGIYTCEAFNNVTGLVKTAKHNLMMKDAEAQIEEGLSSGAIAGIVIAVLLVLAIIICCCVKKKKKATDIPSPY